MIAGETTRGRLLVTLLAAGAMTLAACTAQEGSEDRTATAAPTDPAASDPQDTTSAAPPTDPAASSPGTEPSEAAVVTETPAPPSDPVDEPPCTAEDLSGGDDALSFASAYVVDDGTLGGVCFGDVDHTLIRSWDELAAISPSEMLDDIALFGGFEASGDEIDTLAFVTVLDEEGTAFQMSVNLAAAVEDPDELMLTMAHELTHVFTATPDQVDRFVLDDCPTYFNGEGCYLPGSVMAAWIDTFWYEEILSEIDPFEDSPASEAEERCDLDAGFFGSYAATSPEEDFAESFSAYVYRLEPDSAEQQLRLDWIGARPDLAEFRARAVDAGRGPLPNFYEICGE